MAISRRMEIDWETIKDAEELLKLETGK